MFPEGVLENVKYRAFTDKSVRREFLITMEEDYDVQYKQS